MWVSLQSMRGIFTEHDLRFTYRVRGRASYRAWAQVFRQSSGKGFLKSMGNGFLTENGEGVLQSMEKGFLTVQWGVRIKQGGSSLQRMCVKFLINVSLRGTCRSMGEETQKNW